MKCSVCGRACDNYSRSQLAALPTERKCLDCAPETRDEIGNCPSATARALGAAGGPGSSSALEAKNPGPLFDDIKRDRLGVTYANGAPVEAAAGAPLPVVSFDPGEPMGTSPSRVRAAVPHRDTDTPAGSRTF